MCVVGIHVFLNMELWVIQADKFYVYVNVPHVDTKAIQVKGVCFFSSYSWSGYQECSTYSYKLILDIRYYYTQDKGHVFIYFYTENNPILTHSFYSIKIIYIYTSLEENRMIIYEKKIGLG